MAENSGRWAAIRARTVDTPERRARYERTKHQVVVTRQILQRIDAERERRGMSKADLAHLIGMTPSVVRRLFASEASNPGLGTVVAMADALELCVQVGPPARRGRATAGDIGPAARATKQSITTRELVKAS